MKLLEQKKNGSWYKDEYNSEVFIPNDDKKLIEAWKQTTAGWQLAKEQGIYGRQQQIPAQIANGKIN